MGEDILELFSIIQTEIYQPLYNAFSNTQWYGNFMGLINGLLTNIFQMFNDTRTIETTLNIFTAAASASLCSILVLIWFVSLLVKIFKLSFLTLKKVYLNIIETGPTENGSSKTWRKQWRRKK